MGQDMDQDQADPTQQDQDAPQIELSDEQLIELI